MFIIFGLKSIIKQLLDSVVVICKIINVLINVITLTSDIDHSAYHKNGITKKTL